MSKEVEGLTSSTAVTTDSVCDRGFFWLKVRVIAFLDCPLDLTLTSPCCLLFRLWLEIRINSHKDTRASPLHALSHTTRVGPPQSHTRCLHFWDLSNASTIVPLIFLSEPCIWQGWGVHGQAITVTEGRIYVCICVSPLFTSGLGRPLRIVGGGKGEQRESSQYSWSQGGVRMRSLLFHFKKSSGFWLFIDLMSLVWMILLSGSRVLKASCKVKQPGSPSQEFFSSRRVTKEKSGSYTSLGMFLKQL